VKRSRFVGRDEELELLTDELRHVVGDEPRLVLIEGDAGIGKTSLVREFLEDADELQVLRAVGEEAAGVSSYDVVSQLGLTGPPLGSERARWLKHPIQVGADFLALLGEFQAGGPLCVVVDDAHWADRLSLQALLFALRRLQRDRVLTIMTFRPDGIPQGFYRLAGLAGREIKLSGLPLSALRDLAAGTTPHRPSERTVRRLWEHTAGNPLYATALLRELGPEEIAEGALLPAPRVFADSVGQRLDGCTAGTQRLLAGASVLGLATPLPLAADVAGVADGLAKVEEAIAAELVEPAIVSASMSMRFSHPLVRASLYHRLTAGERALLHRRAADKVSDQRVALRHRVAAAEGYDGDLARELATHAEAERRRGAWAAAGADYLDAARLTPDGADRAEWHWCAVESWLDAGDVHEASRIAESAPPTDDEVRRGSALGRLAIANGRFEEAERVLRHAWEHAPPTIDPDRQELRRAVAAQLGQLFLVQGHGADAVMWGRRALEADPALKSPTDDLHGTIALGLAISGRTSEALARLDWVSTSGGDFDALAVDGATARGIVRMFADDLDGARADFTAVVEVGRDRWPYDRLAQAHGYLADVEYRAGRWDSSVVHGERALAIAADADQFWMLAFLHAEASWVWARRGRWDEATTHVDAARVAAQQLHMSASDGYAATAAAVLAHSRADPAGVIAATDPLLVAHVDGILEPGVFCWPELRAEALVRVGRLADAESFSERLLSVADDRGRHSTQASAHRVRALLEATRGRAASAAEQFELALQHAELAPRPFEQALLHLDYGSYLRRRGQRRSATGHLRSAEEAISRLAAAPFLATVATELAACGTTPRARTNSDRLKLTPQELAVAHLVAEGLSNRELASHLVISQKTVEYHLRNVYIKLDVSSRVQLTNLLAGEQTSPSER